MYICTICSIQPCNTVGTRETLTETFRMHKLLLRMKIPTPVVVAVVLASRLIEAIVDIVDFDEHGCVGSQTYIVNDLRYTDIIWHGQTMTSNCYLTFNGFPEDFENISDKYELCVQVLRYDVSPCNFQLKFSSMGESSKNFSCNQNAIVPSKDKWCYKEGHLVSLIFTFKDIESSDSIVNVRVTANLIYRRKRGKTYYTQKALQNNPLKGWQIGLIITGVVLIVLVIVCVSFWTKRK